MFVKIDVPAKNETINTYKEVHFSVKLRAVHKPLAYFNFPTISMLIKMRNIYFSYITRTQWLILLAYSYFQEYSPWLLLSFQCVFSF